MNFKLLKDINPNWSFSKLRLDVRREHTDLTTPCELGKSKTVRTNQKRIRKKLMLHLGLTEELIKGMQTCHLCTHDSTHGGCQNVAHVYFGTVQENRLDKTEGHFNHTPAPPGTYDDPYCPDCGFTSGAKTHGKRWRNVKRHIKNKSCNSLGLLAAKEERV